MTTPQSDPLATTLQYVHSLPIDKELAYLFPGQGSQKTGMGRDAAERSPSARAVFDAANDILSSDLSRLCFEGPDDELTLTSNAQPAILTTSLAVLAAAAESETLTARPAFVAGHSLGQYTALITAGAISFADGLRTVRERGRLMAEAGKTQPGTMAAIVALDEGAVEEICRESGAEPANYNLASQMVIGGTPESVELARELAKERGGKGLAVNVSGAFHTSLMQPAAEKLGVVLREIDVSEPVIPVVSNVTGAPVGRDGILDDLEVQVIRPVRWHQSITYMTDRGVRTFAEIGHGQVLGTMMKRHSADLQMIYVDGTSTIGAPSRV